MSAHDTPRGRLDSASAVHAYALAGNATLTLQSVRTGVRFTYRLRAARDGKLTFVEVLTGADNEAAFAYLGTIRDDAFAHGRKSEISATAPSAAAFAWTWERVAAGHMPDTLEVWHEGRCGRCNRKLTVPESIASGIGPECAKHALAA